MAKEQAIHCFLLDPLKGTVLLETQTPTIQTSDQILSVAVTKDGGRLAFTTASTEIYTARLGEEPVKLYDGRDFVEFSIPSDVHFFNGDIYFADLGRDAIMRLSSDDGRITPLFNAIIAGKGGYDDAFFECKSFQISQSGLTLANNGKIVFLNTQNGQPALVLAQARGDGMFWLKRIAIWLLLLLLAGITVTLIGMIIRSATPEELQSFRRTTMVALMVSTAVGITAFMIFDDLSLRLAEETELNLRGFMEVGRQVVDSEAVDRVRHVQDSMSDDYQSLLGQLRQTITRDNAIAAGTYAGIYKVHGNKLVALAYHDGLRGIFSPYDYQYDQSVYSRIAASDQTYIGRMVDIYGVWLIGVLPLHNSRGDFVGFLEVGVDQSAQTEANWTLLKRTLGNTAMILFVLAFAFSEVSVFSSKVLNHRRLAAAGALWQYDQGALRFLSFLGLTGVFLSASFLPLYSKSLASPMGPIPLDMVVGLPMVFETLIGAATALLYGRVRFHVGLRTDIILGSLIIAIGMAITALTSNFAGLVSGRATVGLGMGLLMLAFRTSSRVEQDKDRGNSGIIALAVGVTAGINAGSVSGGMLADRFGMDWVFWAQAILLTLTALGALLLLRNQCRPESTVNTSISLAGFLRDRSVFAFLFFALLPITACVLFLGFFFPLFAENKGMGPNEISLAFMLFGMASVHIGPSLTRITSFLFGTRGAIAVGALVMVGALLLFASFQTLVAATLAVILFGLSDGVIVNQGIAYFTALPSVQRLGEDKAMGMYSVFESGGMALGPVAFGLAMSLGLGVGITAMAGLLAVGSGLFLISSRSHE
jgi:predicted MFS family arabinose efflux permease